MLPDSPTRYGAPVRGRRRSSGRRVSRGVLAAFFVSAGTLHFVKPEPYEAIVPPSLPLTREIVYVTGVAELVGGLAVLSSRWRPWAGWWLIGLLIAVFPANVYHAVAAEQITGDAIPKPLLWIRLPLQALLIAWVWRAAEADLALRRRGRLGRAREALRRRR